VDSWQKLALAAKLSGCLPWPWRKDHGLYLVYCKDVKNDRFTNYQYMELSKWQSLAVRLKDAKMAMSVLDMQERVWTEFSWKDRQDFDRQFYHDTTSASR
jgi:hypothetical protein